MEYLFGLAHVCHVTPSASWDLPVIEFAALIRDIDEFLAARQPAPG